MLRTVFHRAIHFRPVMKQENVTGSKQTLTPSRRWSCFLSHNITSLLEHKHTNKLFQFKILIHFVAHFLSQTCIIFGTPSLWKPLFHSNILHVSLQQIMIYILDIETFMWDETNRKLWANTSKGRFPSFGYPMKNFRSIFLWSNIMIDLLEFFSFRLFFPQRLHSDSRWMHSLAVFYWIHFSRRKEYWNFEGKIRIR